MAQITKELARKIIKKLGGEVLQSSSAHEHVVVREAGRVIAQFGIRRGSNKDASHDHVPGDIHVSPRQARLLG